MHFQCSIFFPHHQVFLKKQIFGFVVYFYHHDSKNAQNQRGSILMCITL